ncbi:LOW QUALITY PROTEIN: transmembrane 6 superfamily member 1-like [Neosynchiropus ocellatus]
MSASAGTGAFVLSLMSIPICYIFNTLSSNNSSGAFAFAGCTSLLILVISVRFVLQKTNSLDPLFYVYGAHAFLSVVNLIIGLEQDSIIDGFITFYLKEANPHINTAHGHMIAYWDGCVHYLMYLLMIAAITWGQVNCIPNAAYFTYDHGDVIHDSSGTTIEPLDSTGWGLSSCMPSFTFWEMLRENMAQKLPNSEDEEQTIILSAADRSLARRALDVLFIIYLVLALGFCVFRGLIALDCSSQWCHDYTQQYEPYLKDPSAYPKVQMVAGMLYSGPYYVIALYGLLVPGCEWMPDLTLVHSGAVAQAQFSHVGASLHTRTPFSYRVPADGQSVFLLVNILYALIPQVLCYRCSTSPEFFRKLTAKKKAE